MKKTTTLALTLGLFAAAAQLHAQDPTTTEFIVQDITVSLTGFAQGTETTSSHNVKSVKVTSKDIINALAVTGSNAKLVVATPTDGTTPSSFFVQTGSGNNIAFTDVTGHFSGQTLLMIEKSKTSSSGKVTGTQYSIDQFMFGGTEQQAVPLSLNLQGFSTTTMSNHSLVSNVNGTGNINGEDAVLKGTVKFGAGKTRTITTTP